MEANSEFNALWVKYMHRIRAHEDADDRPRKFSVMRTDKDGLAELGGLQNCGRREARGCRQQTPRWQRICRGELTMLSARDSAGEGSPFHDCAARISLRYLRATLRLQKNAQYAAARGPSQRAGCLINRVMNPAKSVPSPSTVLPQTIYRSRG